MRYFFFRNHYPVKIHVYSPKNIQQQGITLVLLTAVGVSVKKYHLFISALTQSGFEVITADYPCCGENTPHINPTIDYNYSDLVSSFIPELVNCASQPQVILVGHSLGAHLATLYSSQTCSKVIGIATGNIHYKNWSGLQRFKMLGVAALFKALCHGYGYFPGDKVGFANKEAKGLMLDWCHTVWTGNYHFFAKEIKPIQAACLFINIEGDHYSPEKSTRALSDLYQNSMLIVTQLTAPLSGHPHSKWLKQPQQIVDIIIQHTAHLSTPTVQATSP